MGVKWDLERRVEKRGKEGGNIVEIFNSRFREIYSNS